MVVTVKLPRGSTVKDAGPGWTVRGNAATLRIALTRDLVTRIVF
jgi:hypothetical protein